MSNLIASPTYLTVTGSGTMWDDFKIGIPGLYDSVDLNFTSWVPDMFTVTEVGTTTQLLVDVAGGALIITSGASENDGAQMQLGGSADGETVGESFAPVASKKSYFETTVTLNDATQTDFFVGLHVQDTTIIASRGSDYIGFRKDDGDALLDVEAASGSSASDATSITTMSDATKVTLGFKVNGTDSVEFWVDGSLVKTISTDIPTALMKLSVAFLTGDASANTMSMDYLRYYQER